MEIPDLIPFERKVRDAFPRGRDVEFSGADGEKAEQGQPERSIRAEVLRRLLVRGRPADGEIASLRLTGVRVTGRLELKHATVPCKSIELNRVERYEEAVAAVDLQEPETALRFGSDRYPGSYASAAKASALANLGQRSSDRDRSPTRAGRFPTPTEPE